MLPLLGKRCTKASASKLGLPTAIASASISIIISGSMSRRTSTIDVVGGWVPKNCPCARPISCQQVMSVTNIRVRVTLESSAPSPLSASWMISMQRTVWAYGSPGACTLPSSATGAHPVTKIRSPARRARQYSILDSQGAPLKTLWNDICISLPNIGTEAIPSLPVAPRPSPVKPHYSQYL